MSTHAAERSYQIYGTRHYWWSFWWSLQKRNPILAYILAIYWRRRSQSEKPNLEKPA